MPKRIVLETYDDKTVYSSSDEIKIEAPVKKESLWDIITNKVKKTQATKKEENDFKDSIRQEAKEEARVEVVPILKEKYKQEEIDRITGKNKGDLMEKFKKGLTGSNGGFLASDDKINKMLGKTSSSELETKKKDMSSKISSGGTMMDNDKLLNTIGKNKDRIKKEPYSSGISNESILSKMSITGGKKRNSDALSNDKINKKIKMDKKKKNSKVVGDDKIKNMISNKHSTTEDKIRQMLR